MKKTIDRFFALLFVGVVCLSLWEGAFQNIPFLTPKNPSLAMTNLFSKDWLLCFLLSMLVSFMCAGVLRAIAESSSRAVQLWGRRIAPTIVVITIFALFTWCINIDWIFSPAVANAIIAIAFVYLTHKRGTQKI